MVDSIYEMDTTPRKPEVIDYIPEGLPVIDIHGRKVGTVKYFQSPSTSVNPELSEFPPELRSASLPDEMIYRILNAGFMCVNAGILAKDRFVMLHQIDYIRDGEVHLQTSAGNLFKA